MKQALVFSVNDAYAFSLGNVLMSLVDASSEVLPCDIIVYTNDMSNTHAALLKKICPTIVFTKMNNILQKDDITDRWGEYILQKLNCFGLLATYDTVIYLDADILIRGSIAKLFTVEEIAWLNVSRFWRFNKILNSPTREDDSSIPCCQGGVVVFSKKLLNYNIDDDFIRTCYTYISQGGGGSVEERLLTYIAYAKHLQVTNLPIQYNFLFPRFSKYKFTNEPTIIHFEMPDSKPWRNKYAQIPFPEWFVNHKKWLKSGGTGPRFVFDTSVSSSCKTYNFLTSSERWLPILPYIDLVKHPEIYFSYALDTNYGKFFISGLDKTIFYALVLHKDMFTVCFCIENEYLAHFSQLQMLVKNAKNQLDSLLPAWTVTITSHFLRLECETPPSFVNFMLNNLVAATFPAVTSFFRTDVPAGLSCGNRPHESATEHVRRQREASAPVLTQPGWQSTGCMRHEISFPA